ncbi:MAG TPA: ABC transporter permease [Xanthobacteraceae bacterium]|jgi:putative ABC transport system permease protein
MPMILILAFRNLFQDRLRFIATIVGIVFSIVLVTVQMGLFLSFERMVTTMIAHASADLWVMPRGTKCFEDPSLIDEQQRFRALSIREVTAAVPVVIGFAQWRLPSGGTTPVFVVGSDAGPAELQPWDLMQGDLRALSLPDAVAVDQSYFERLETAGIGEKAEINDQSARILAVTKGIRAFTTTPYVFTSLDRARRYIGTPATKASYFLLRLSPDADVEQVRSRLRATLSDAEVLTPREFAARSRSFWLFGTGAGAALFAGALLGIIVGTVIVAQTLYSSTKDHLDEFATLRAIGSSGMYLQMVIVFQGVLNAVIGFCIAAAMGLIIVQATAETALPLVMTPGLMLALFGLTVVMCVLSATSAIVQVMRIDPVTVFTR